MSLKSLTTIPKPVKDVFDTFPLKTFGPIPNNTRVNEESIELNKYYFHSIKDEDNSKSFQLGVHNMIKYNNVYVASDPSCLAQQMILCLKNDLKISLQEQTTSENCCFIISHHGSPDGELPTLVENNQEKRVIRTTNVIRSFNVSGLKSQELMINEVIEYQLYDGWIMMCLLELDDATLLDIYTKSATDTMADKLLAYNLRTDLTSWNNFNSRYHNMVGRLKYHDYSMLKRQYELTLDSIEDVLANLSDRLQNKAYINGELGVLDCKLSGILKCVSIWGQNTQYGALVNRYENLVDYSEKVLNEFI